MEITITDSFLNTAKEKAKELGKLNNSILYGDGNLTGFLGELVAHSILGGHLKNTYDYDILLDNGCTVDVKSKKTKVKPKDYYECSVAAFNTKQKCDYYCFVRIKDDYSTAWYLGYYPKEKYYKDAVFLKKGDIDPSNMYTVKADCYNLKINELYKEFPHEKVST
ncbi:MAG: hypothetical protein ACO29M_07215 [Fluviibacter sp.]